MKIKSVFVNLIRKILLLFKKTDNLLLEQSINDSNDESNAKNISLKFPLYHEKNTEEVTLNLPVKEVSFNYDNYEDIFNKCQIIFKGEKKYLGELIVHYLKIDCNSRILEKEEDFLKELFLLDDDEIFMTTLKYQYNNNNNEDINGYIDISRNINLENKLYSLLVEDNLYLNDTLKLESNKVNMMYDSIDNLRKLKDNILYSQTIAQEQKSKLSEDLSNLHFWEISEKRKLKCNLNDINLELDQYKESILDLNYNNRINDLKNSISKIINISQYKFVKLCFGIIYVKLMYKNIFTEDLLD